MDDISKIREAVRAEGVDYWLFCNFHHRDKLADRVLGLSPDTTNSRFWFYFVPASGDAIRIVHGVEAGALDSVPGTLRSYTSRDSLEKMLAEFAGKRVGIAWSETVAAVSTLDFGTARLLEKAGLHLVPGDGLVQRLQGLLDAEGIASHEAAGRNLYAIVERVWARVCESHRGGERPTELSVQGWILSLIEDLGMETDHPPIVAAGPHSNDPHFAPDPSTDRIFAPGDIIQFDLWARFKKPLSTWADISWLGIFGPEPPEKAKKPFAALVAARDGAVRHIADHMAKGEILAGASVDAFVRSGLIAAGYGAALRHRTGHGIDVEVHGSGANLDSIEFPDSRRLVDGACFSIEPGLYFEDFGLRTEIDVYISGGKPVISGGRPQTSFLTCAAK